MMKNPFETEEDVGKGGPSIVGPRWVRRKGSVTASIRSVSEILWKDDTARSLPETRITTPLTSRRSSAWAVGKGSLGLTMDPWGGEVTGK